MYEKLVQLILAGRFEQALTELETLTGEQIEPILLSYQYDSPHLLIYSFLAWAAQKTGSPDWHYRASLVLSQPLCHLPGVYPTAFYHAKRACELSSGDTSLLEYLLFFATIPDPLLSPEETITTAKSILQIDPENATALKHVGLVPPTAEQAQ